MHPLRPPLLAFNEGHAASSGVPLTRKDLSRDEIEWTKRFPNQAVDGREDEIEVRRLFELDDFGPSEAAERFREMGVGGKK